MRIIKVQCDDNESFKYSILLYLYYYNIKSNHGRISQLINHIGPYTDIEFNNNNNNDIFQFEKDNQHINLLITDTNCEPMFLSRNNAPIRVIIVKINDRYAILKPTKQRFNDNITEINKINSIPPKIYKLTDEIKKELALDSNIYQKM